MRKVACIRVFESCVSDDRSVLEIDAGAADRVAVIARLEVEATHEGKLALVRQILSERLGIEAGKISWRFV